MPPASALCTVQQGAWVGILDTQGISHYYSTTALQHYNTTTLQHLRRTTILAIIALPANTGVTAAVVTDGCVGGVSVRAIYNTSWQKEIRLPNNLGLKYEIPVSIFRGWI